jgi:hypothetical protein
MRRRNRPVAAQEAKPRPHHHEVVRELVEGPIRPEVRAEREREQPAGERVRAPVDLAERPTSALVHQGPLIRMNTNVSAGTFPPEWFPTSSTGPRSGT